MQPILSDTNAHTNALFIFCKLHFFIRMCPPSARRHCITGVHCVSFLKGGKGNTLGKTLNVFLLELRNLAFSLTFHYLQMSVYFNL